MSSLQHTSILTKSNEFPSIFDLIAQENLQNLFQSTFELVYQWLDNQHVAIIQRIKPFKDTFYLLLHISLDYLHLNYKNGLFSEVFYGMKRDKKLNKSLKIRSIVFSIIFPFVKTKLDRYFEDLERIKDELPIENKCKMLFIRLYPYFNLIWYLIFWFFRMMFTFGLTKYHSPLLLLSGLQLVLNTDPNEAPTKGLFAKLSNLLHLGLTGLLFFIQFLSWYQNSSDEEEYFSEEYPKACFNIKFLEDNDTKSSEIQPPPNLSDEQLVKMGLCQKHLKDSLCPICNQTRTNDCALSTCGFAFCYPCIFKYIGKSKCCPITKIPCTFDAIIRIYNS